MKDYSKMTLVEAFMERNDIKKEILMLSSDLNNIVTEKGEDVFIKGISTDPKESVITVLNKMEELRNLNIAIAKANLVNHEILKSLETIDAKIHFLDSVKERAKTYKPKLRNSFRKETDPEFIEYTLNIDAEFVNTELINLKKEKRDLEKTLSKNNGITYLK